MYGYEALLRASLPDGTPVTPESVYRAARATSWLPLVEEKSRRVAFDAAAKPPISAETVFVNLDPAITSIDVPNILVILAEAGRRPESVIFELVESAWPIHPRSGGCATISGPPVFAWRSTI